MTFIFLSQIPVGFSIQFKRDIEEKSGIQAISQEMFVHPLIKAVQELSAKVEALEAQVSGSS